jgi:esterase/lipase superfamily enzyme
MGNRALMDVLHNVKNYPGLSRAKFGQIILAAPDIDARVFRQAAAAYPRLSARTTLYVCSKDRALQLSGHGHDNIRTGYCPPVTVVKGIDTIEVSGVDLDALGHSYYAEAGPVLRDIWILLKTGSPPSDRPALSGATCDDSAYWSVRAEKA